MWCFTRKCERNIRYHYYNFVSKKEKNEAPASDFPKRRQKWINENAKRRNAANMSPVPDFHSVIKFSSKIIDF